LTKLEISAEDSWCGLVWGIKEVRKRFHPSYEHTPFHALV